MQIYIPVLRDEDHELPVPTIWRESISRIVDDIAEMSRERIIRRSYSNENWQYRKNILSNVISYGAELDFATDSIWEYSRYIWSIDHWEVLVDLFSNRQITDLVLFLHVTIVNESYVFEIDSVHVP